MDGILWAFQETFLKAYLLEKVLSFLRESKEFWHHLPDWDQVTPEVP